MDHPRRDPLVWALAGVTLLAHLAVANRYDFFRDELYFIICGRHPSFGYIDQPPLVPLLSAATQAFGEHLWLLRALPALAAGATVLVTGALARLAGAGRFGIALAGLAAGFAPMYLGVQTTLGTSSFEPLAWTALTYFVARAIGGEARAWILAGLVAGVDLECKYELPLYLVPLGVALLVTGRARACACRELLVGAALATAIALPSAVWQLAHGLPFLELVRTQAAEGKNITLSPGAFVLDQAFVMNPLFAPLWLAAVVGPFADRRLRPWRWVSVAFALTFALMIALHAKDYYLAPAYGAAFAVGGAALEAWVRSRAVRSVYVAAALAASAMLAPLAMPILDPPVLAAYMRTMHLAPPAAERLRQSQIPQTFADMLGWRSYERSIAAVFHALPPDEQRHAAILTGNYGEAAALDFYGAADRLPPALSMHNHYFLWGTHGFDGSVLIRSNEEPEKLAPRCREVTLGGRFGAPYVMPFEDDAPISVCHGLRTPLDELWPKLKFYY